MRSRYQGGIVAAVVSAGFAVTVAGCGPVHLAGGSGQPTSSPSQSSTAGMGQGSGSTSVTASTYSFRTLDDPADVTFNQLLGINNHDVIAGYFGSGAAGHPNQGYALSRTSAGFTVGNENFPGSVQTQVTGLNDRGVTVGFWSSMNNANQTNDNTGFYNMGGSFHSVRFPTTSNATPPVNQLLGVNDSDVAVGFYTDASGNNHGYTYRIFSGRFRSVTVSGSSSVTATAINDSGDVAGFFVSSAGTTDGFLKTGEGHVYTLAYPGAAMTQALGVNDLREVVGVYTVGTGSNAVSHGFTWSQKHGFQTVDDPQGAGTTTINGVNDEGDLVGFYTDSAGNTDGFAATPSGQGMLPGLVAAATASPSMSPSSTMSPSMMPTSSPSGMPSSSMSGTPSTQPTSPSSIAPSMAPSAQPTPSNLQPTHY